jgi:hypothetical protein
MYEELLPPLQESLANYSEAWIEDGKATLSNPRFTEGLMERIERLEHISAMAGREERRLVGHITRKVAEHQESVIESDDDKVRVAENVREISRAISELDARLRKKVD